MQMVPTTRYSVIFQKITSRVRVAQEIPSSIRVAGTRWGLLVTLKAGAYFTLFQIHTIHESH